MSNQKPWLATLLAAGAGATACDRVAEPSLTPTLIVSKVDEGQGAAQRQEQIRRLTTLLDDIVAKAEQLRDKGGVEFLRGAGEETLRTAAHTMRDGSGNLDFFELMGEAKQAVGNGNWALAVYYIDRGRGSIPEAGKELDAPLSEVRSGVFDAIPGEPLLAPRRGLRGL